MRASSELDERASGFLAMTQLSSIGTPALITNRALAPLSFLIGEWSTRGTHPAAPGATLPGRALFAPHEGGAFLIMHTDMEDPRFPSGVAIIGSDGESGRLVMSYFDQRGVSRLFEVNAGDQTMTWRRDDPKLAQTCTISADGGDRLVSKGRMSQDGGAWSDDLSQISSV